MTLLSGALSRAKINHTIDNDLFALFTFTPPKMKEVERAPLDLALVVDRSGSMGGDKIDYVRRSLTKLVELMKDNDSVAIVDFDDQVTVTAPPTKCDAAGKAALLTAIRTLEARGSTNLSGGLFKGLEFVAGRGADEKRVRKCLLFTDGQANQGVQDPKELAKLATEMRNGTGISTFGYGHGYNADLLGALAQNGGAYFIDSPDKILTAFGTELGGLISTFGQNVEMRLHPGEDVEVDEVLNDITVDQDGGAAPSTVASQDLIVHCEDLLAEQPYFIAVKLKAKPRANAFPRDVTLLSATVKFMNLATGKLDECGAKASVRFVKPGEEDTKDDDVVMKQIGFFQVAQAQVQAIYMANAGNYAGAAQHMNLLRSAVMSYSPDAAMMAAGTSALVGDENMYKGGGHQVVRTAVRAAMSNRGGMEGQAIGDFELNCFASPVQSSTAAAFDQQAVPNVVLPADYVGVIPAPAPVIIDPASTQGVQKAKKSAAKSRSGKRW